MLIYVQSYIGNNLGLEIIGGGSNTLSAIVLTLGWQI
jgi:hypothetical protein